MPNNAFPFFIALFILIVLVFLIIYKSKKSTTSFDERQLIARNMAYKWAFAALGIYFVAGELVTLISGADWCTPECNIGLGLLLSVGTFSVISVIKDAYAPFGGNVANSLFVFILLGGYQLFTGISDVIEYGILQDRLLNLPLSLCIGVLFVVISITQLIKLAIDQKSTKDEE